MSLTPHTGGNPPAQSENFNHCLAQQYWLLHRALMNAAKECPQLLNDDLFHAFRAEAYERFDRAFRGAK